MNRQKGGGSIGPDLASDELGSQTAAAAQMERFVFNRVIYHLHALRDGTGYNIYFVESFPIL